MADKQTVEAQIDEIIRELTGIDELNDNDLYKKQASVKARLNQLLIKERQEAYKKGYIDGGIKEITR
jgi:hypothetical protein